jgi:hypothetical protein
MQSVPSTTEAFITLWDNRSYSLSISVHILCHQPLCHNCYFLRNICKFVSMMMLLQHQKCMAVPWWQITLMHKHTQISVFIFLSDQITLHVNLFLDQPSYNNLLNTNYNQTSEHIVHLKTVIKQTSLNIWWRTFSTCHCVYLHLILLDLITHRFFCEEC